jgi:FkbM family methyltransferase
VGGIAHGSKLELDLSREKAYWWGQYEPEVQDFMRSAIGPGDVVYDIGAHIGFFSVCAARLGAKVYAFEPSPDNAARIRRHAELNGLSIDVVEGAVWDSEQGVSLQAGGSSSEWRAVAGGPVASLTLDGFVHDHAPPTFLKIDVEGAEASVLRGGRDVLRRSCPIILCELHGDDARSEVVPLLSGYDLQPIESEWRLGAHPRTHTVVV